MSVSRRVFTSGLAILPLVKARPQAPEAQASSEQPSPAWQARFFDEHQLETVAVIAERIIPATDTPGAREALVHQHLDSILADSPEAVRTRFLEGLWWLDGYCLRSEGKPFKELTPTAQTELLLRLHDSSEPDLEPGKNFVGLAKTWTAKIYYSTQIGEQELNKGGRVPSSYATSCQA